MTSIWGMATFLYHFTRCCRWLIYVIKLGGLSFRQWLGSCLVMWPANIPWSNLLVIIEIRWDDENSTVCSTACLGLQERKHQGKTFLSLWEGNWCITGNSVYKGPVMRKCFHALTLSWEIATYKSTSFISFIDDRFIVSMKTSSRRFDSFCR